MTSAEPDAVTMTGAQFRRLLAAVLPSALADDILPMLCAVHLESGPRGLYAVATDRYTIAVARHDDPDPARQPAQVTIARKAAATMARLVSRRDRCATVTVADGEHLTLRTATGVTYTAPAVGSHGDGDGFPDWRGLFRRLMDRPADGQPVYLNAAYLARFAAAADSTGLRVAACRTPGSACHTLVITAGDWFLGALMARTAPALAAISGGPAAWHDQLTPSQAQVQVA